LRLCRFRSAVTASQSVFSPFDFASLPRGCHSRIKIKKNLTVRRSRKKTKCVQTSGGEDILFDLSEPTAVVTGLFFKHGAIVVGNKTTSEAMNTLGQSFGRLIYLLDAFTDYEKDAQRNEFNAIRAAYKIEEKKLTKNLRRKFLSILEARKIEVIAAINALPLSDELKEIFAERLKTNLATKLNQPLPVIQKVCATKHNKLTLKERFERAKKTAREMKHKHLESAKSYFAKAQTPLIFAGVVFVAMLLPHQVSHAKSWRECFGFGFNLMFLGAAIGAVVTPIKTTFAMNPNDAMQQMQEGQRRKSRWCDSCDCSCCNCCDCDCCCNSCNCCDGCDCCGCDCN